MKDRNSNRRLKRKSLKIRVPGDYPWHILSHICDFGSRCYPTRPLSGQDSGDFTLLERIIRSRSVEGLESWITAHGLQSINQGTYDEPGLPALLYLTAAICKKYPMWSSPEERKLRAIDGFREADTKCQTFNERRWSRLLGNDGGLHPVFTTASEIIAKIIGYIPPSMSELTYSSRHGPGSTSSLRRQHSHVYFKYHEWPYSVTPGALSHARDAITSDQRWIGALEDSYREKFNVDKWRVLNQDLFWSTVLDPVPGNRITTVPKDGRKDRPIAMEPTLNIYLQLGVHGFIHKRLRRWGVNLESQVLNRKLAYRGSVDGSFATIDLSSASDSISLKLVEQLFPPDWYRYLCDLRSPQGELPDGTTISYEKLSSMGNGFTFAIETLVFFALAAAVQVEYEGRFRYGTVSVFGDDIIVPTVLYQRTTQILDAAGFTVNTEKSFSSGPVRESCGVDCYKGFDINPVEIDRVPSTVMDLYCDRNRLHYWFRTVFGLPIPEPLDDYFLGLIPKRYHLFGPESDDIFDTYVHSDGRLDPYKSVFPVCGQESYWQGWSYKAIQTIIPEQKPISFFFGRLLASHRPGGDSISQWSKTPITGTRYSIPLTERTWYKVATCITPFIRGLYKLDRASEPSK